MPTYSSENENSDYESDVESSVLSDDSTGESTTNPTAECIRRVSNFSMLKPYDLLDRPVFNPEYLAMRMERAAPKLVELFNRIKRLDAQDEQIYGKKFKHMIFTDQRSSNYGAKLVASAFIANGFKETFRLQGKGFHLLTDEELQGEEKTFGLLMSKPVFGRPLSIAYKRALLEKYNRRPDNIHGDLLRFIILDQGFKEGIDLYDVKYIHLLEPLTIQADEKQAIGRGTRFCGQQGLKFHPTYGWPLYVFKYDVGIRNNLTFHDLYLQYANIDLRKVAFAAEIEDATIEGAVDSELTKAIHGFTIPPPSPILKGGGGDKPSEMNPAIQPPKKRFNHTEMKAYIQKVYAKDFSYGDITLQNNCATSGGSKKLPQGTLVQFTPTQDFIRHYMTPESPMKGMLLWHSVGTGKTCTAIATASSTFEPAGYTILWVTRHTLKSDIFKNLFRQVCSLVIQRKLVSGEMTLPASKKQLGERWIEPISYKQFTNLLTKKNNYYDKMVKRNGSEDPLRKTLLIIDEAHKLYSPGVAASEKPNTDILEDMIQNSYRTSGADSVRLLVMTATPYTEDGMEMVQLLNLLRPANDQFPVDFEMFAKKYLDTTGVFTATGRTRWLNAISGYVSYLNRSKDARNFAYPVLENVVVPMTGPMTKEEAKKLPESGYWMTMKNKKESFKEARAAMRIAMRDAKSDFKEEVKDAVRACKEKVKAELQALKEDLKAAKAECREKHKKKGDASAKEECMNQATKSFAEKEMGLNEKKANCKNANPLAETDDEAGDVFADIQRQYEEATVEYRSAKEAYDDLQEQRKERTKTLKDLRPERNHLKERFKALYLILKAARNQAKRVKNILARKRLYADIRKKEGVDAATAKEKFMNVKNEIITLMNENKVLRIKQGATTVGNIAQKNMLDKRCLKID